MRRYVLLLVFMLTNTHHALAAEIAAKLYKTDPQRQPVGEVTFTDTKHGLLIQPKLSHLPPGLHGFHLHQNPDCGDHGMSAGSHYDPQKSNTHQGPYGAGHLGDLPVLYVSQNGTANTPTLAPRLKTSDLHNLALMIHAGGDNYTDVPKLGGGGARIACGVIR